MYAALADAVVPAQRSHHMGSIIGALEGIPEHTKLLWAASESADYPAYVGDGLLTEQRFWPPAVAGRRFLVTDGNAGRLYGEHLEPLGGRVAIMPGEQSKTVAHAEIVWTELARAGMTRERRRRRARRRRGRRPGRLLRGHLPARGPLRAGADDAGGPGRLGLWRQDRASTCPRPRTTSAPSTSPSAVIADTADARHAARRASSRPATPRCVKTALIAGGDLGAGPRRAPTRTRPADDRRVRPDQAAHRRPDERDAGVRQVLNLGHTVGHAIETATGYAALPPRRGGRRSACSRRCGCPSRTSCDAEVAELLAGPRPARRGSNQADPGRRGHGHGPRQEAPRQRRGAVRAARRARRRRARHARCAPRRSSRRCESCQAERAMRNRVEVMHGVNLDQLGRRDPAHYGALTLERARAADRRATRRELGLAGAASSRPTTRASSSSTCTGSTGWPTAIVLNPGAWTHYSYAIRDALEITGAARGRGAPLRRRLARGTGGATR